MKISEVSLSVIKAHCGISGEDNVTEYLCRLSVFTPKLDFALYRRIKAAMRKADFGYISGGQTGTDALFPHITHYYLDFLGVEDNE